MKTFNVAIVIGSLRKGSFSKQVALNLQKLSPGELKLHLIDISGLEMYNQDLEESGQEPASWKQFRQEVLKHDALLFVTPEYNRSIPGVLKNALDVGSRPYGHSVWDGKPGAIISVSPGAIGGFGANHHLRQMLTFLNVPAMQQPEAYLGNVHKLLNEKGEIANPATLDFLRSFMQAYASWIEKD
ncbi:MAG: NAD(P)H-dependent oxidoreductase [Bacilli bacterium]|jgi:chromate reductase